MAVSPLAVLLPRRLRINAQPLPLMPHAVHPHMRLDQLVLPELAQLEHEKQPPSDAPNDGLVGEHDRPGSLLDAGEALEDHADGDCVEGYRGEHLAADEDERRDAAREKEQKGR